MHNRLFVLFVAFVCVMCFVSVAIYLICVCDSCVCFVSHALYGFYLLCVSRVVVTSFTIVYVMLLYSYCFLCFISIFGALRQLMSNFKNDGLTRALNGQLDILHFLGFPWVV